MIIANPIYDSVFKKLMENDRVAKFFIGTLLNQTIESVEVKPQEFTYIKDLDTNDPEVEKYIKRKLQERLSINVFRLDFLATIVTESGEHKKILIEIQKARNKVDLIRFRNYLAEQYKKVDVVNQENVILPITTIYILGFLLPEIESPCIKVERNYKDLINQKIINQKSEFVEKLTHDSYIVQVQRITDRYQTRLDKLLSVFEQRNFIDDKEIIKDFNHELDDEDILLATNILHYVGANSEERKKIEVEKEAWRTIGHIFEDVAVELNETKKQLVETKKEVDEAKKEVDEAKKEVDEAKKEVDEAKKLVDEKDKVINETQKEADEAKMKADVAKKEAEKAKNLLDEKDKEIAQMLKELEELKKNKK